METWTTGKQSHLLKGLQSGKYRLAEISAPKGYTKWDEPVYFTITDGMTEIPEVILRNYGTIVQVEKQDDTLKTLLSGAKLELVRKDTMKVICRWISEEQKGKTFYGLEPGNYIIRELEAPAGFEKKEEMEIRILWRYRSHRNLFSITAGSVLQAEAEIILFQINLIFPLKRQMKRKIHFLCSICIL